MRSERKFDNEEIPHSTPDKDNDGLQDAEEEYGWTVKRDINGDGDTDDTLYMNGPAGWGYYSETLLPRGEGGEVWSYWNDGDSDGDGIGHGSVVSGGDGYLSIKTYL